MTPKGKVNTISLAMGGVIAAAATFVFFATIAITETHAALILTGPAYLGCYIPMILGGPPPSDALIGTCVFLLSFLAWGALARAIAMQVIDRDYSKAGFYAMVLIFAGTHLLGILIWDGLRDMHFSY